MAEQAQTAVTSGTKTPELVKGLGLFDSTMIVCGSMIGSGIFIVSADIVHQVQSPALLLVVWVVAGIMTLIGALSYGELAAAMPQAGPSLPALDPIPSPASTNGGDARPPACTSLPLTAEIVAVLAQMALHHARR